jgi:hypothetical protein
MALLSPIPFGLGDRQPLDPNLVESLLDVLKLERFDDRFNFLHLSLLWSAKRRVFGASSGDSWLHAT